MAQACACLTATIEGILQASGLLWTCKSLPHLLRISNDCESFANCLHPKFWDCRNFWICAGSPETLTRLFWHCRSTQTFWNNVSQWTSEELDLTNLNITPFSPALCLGIIDNISNLLLHHFLLIARHYIYSCKLRNTIPMVQVYTQLVIRSMEIEKQIAFDNNNLASFRKKWATFKQCPSEYNLTNTVN